MAEEAGYHEILFSMKSSNVRVMIQAYRLLVERADSELRYAYPLHLGVTEAGDGDEGRIKSAMGIGALLEDGLGDTIRVSLTEDPVNEVPVGFDIVKKYNDFYLIKGERAHLPLKHLLEADWKGKNSGTDALFAPFSHSVMPVVFPHLLSLPEFRLAATPLPLLKLLCRCRFPTLRALRLRLFNGFVPILVKRPSAQSLCRFL